MLIGIREDDPAIRRVLSSALSRDGHEVVAAHDGGEALRPLGAESAV